MLSFTIGLPRAGKNKYAVENFSSPGKLWISRDDVRLVLHGKRFEVLREKEVQLIYANAVKTLLKCNPHIHLLLNETNCSVKAVRTVFREYDPTADFIFINTPPEVCKERAILTEQTDLIPVIYRMYDNLLTLADYSSVPAKDEQLAKELDFLIPRSVEKIRREVMGFNKYNAWIKEKQNG